jgi:RNA polymerase sigma factor (sigma-70 family)
MFWWVARRYATGLNEHDVEDLAAVARARFVRAARDFDPSNGATLATYALRVARHNVRRAANQLRRGGVHVPENLDAEVAVERPVSHAGWHSQEGYEFSGEPPARPDPPRAEVPADFWPLVRRHLVGRQRDIIEWRFRDGLRLADCGARLGVSREMARQIERDALERLRKVRAVEALWEELT